MTRSSISPYLGHPARSVVTLPGALNPRRRDHLIAALVSLAVIVGSAGWGELAKGRHPQPRAHAPAPNVEWFTAPWLPPETPDPEPEDAAQAAVDLRPQMLADIPALGPTTFVQPLEPPPAGMMGVGGLLIIPAGPGHLDYGGKIFDPSQLDRQPAPISQTQPTYPFEMRRDNRSGQVVVDFVVDATGRVSRVSAASSSERGFESAAVAAVSKWRFQPGRKGGRAVATHMLVPIVFTLNPDS